MMKSQYAKFLLPIFVLISVFSFGLQFYRLSVNQVKFNACNMKKAEFEKNFCSPEGISLLGENRVEADVIRLGQKTSRPEVFFIKKELEAFPAIEEPPVLGQNHICNFEQALLVADNKCKFIGKLL